MIYLDNCATSWPKPEQVSAEMVDCLSEYCANPGRSGHQMAMKSQETVFDCRVKICTLFGLDNPSNVVFTHNATHALNIVIKGLLSPSDHAVVTSMEHNSVLRPLCATGAMYDMAKADKNGYVNAEDIERLIRPNTALIICTLSSNVCGSVQPFEEIALVAKRHNIPFLLDASQGAGSIDIDMKKMGIDYVACPGHKGLLGPTGTGVLCINSDRILNTLTEGGTGSQSKLLSQPMELPDRLESGTVNVVGIAGLSRGIDYIMERTPKQILLHENMLIDRLAERIKDIPRVRLVGYMPKRRRAGVLSFVIDGMDSISIANRLNINYKIAVRAGFHCAYTAHVTLGTEKTGTVRVSTGPFSTIEDIDLIADAIYKIALQS